MLHTEVERLFSPLRRGKRLSSQPALRIQIAIASKGVWTRQSNDVSDRMKGITPANASRS